MAELGEVARAEVGKFVIFPVTPDVFDRIEFWGVTRQPLERRPAPLPADKLRDQSRPMRRNPSQTTNSLPGRWRTDGRGNRSPAGREWSWDRAGSNSSTR